MCDISGAHSPCSREIKKGWFVHVCVLMLRDHFVDARRRTHAHACARALSFAHIAVALDVVCCIPGDIVPDFGVVIDKLQRTIPYLGNSSFGAISRPGCWAYPDSEYGYRQARFPSLMLLWQDVLHFASSRLLSG